MALNINGTTGISGVDGSASAASIAGTDSNTGLSFASDTVNINTGGITRATVDSTGRLGVGTTSPQLGAHIYHASDNGILLLESGDANCRLDLKDTGGQASIQSISDALTFNTSSSITERMRIDSSGNIMVGCTSSDSNSSTGVRFYSLGAIHSTRSLSLIHI